MKVMKITLMICCLIGLTLQSLSSKDITGSNDAMNSVDAVAYEYASNSKNSPESYSNMRSPKIVSSIDKSRDNSNGANSY